jgi:hypothetical protein
MKRKNPEFFRALKNMPVGTHVVVSAEMQDHGKDTTRTAHGVTNRTHRWVSVPCGPFHAWVTGATWKCDGEVFPPEHIVPYGWEGDVEEIPAGFKVTRKTPVMLVRTAAFSREIAVPVQSVCRSLHDAKAPAVKAWKRSWLSEGDREEMRTVAAAMPRDPRGRFLRKE